MRKPKMGGGKRLHVFIKGNDDVRDSLLSSREGGKMVRRGLRELIRDKYLSDFNIEIVHEPCGRFDLLLQQLGGSPFAEPRPAWKWLCWQVEQPRKLPPAPHSIAR